jgi:hypothetical protein
MGFATRVLYNFGIPLPAQILHIFGFSRTPCGGLTI